MTSRSTIFQITLLVSSEWKNSRGNYSCWTQYCYLMAVFLIIAATLRSFHCLTNQSSTATHQTSCTTNARHTAIASELLQLFKSQHIWPPSTPFLNSLTHKNNWDVHQIERSVITFKRLSIGYDITVPFVFLSKETSYILHI
jgi:hypothetical protein